MANREHLEWLAQGVDSWNRKRQEFQFKPDLSGISGVADLGSIASHSGIPDLRRVNLAGANLKDSNLVGTDLRGATLTASDLREADFGGSDLRDANLREAKVDGGTSLRYAKLFGTNLAWTSYGKATLYGGPNQTTQLCANTDVSNQEVGSISELLEVCDILDSHYYRDHGERVSLYFRGQEQLDWNLEPSVFRSDRCDTQEGEMLSALSNKEPGAFRTPHAVEDWIVAQHHGLRTRLLDITTNPLVALQFSCDLDTKKDGAVHIFAVPDSIVEPFSSNTSSIIANFAKLSPVEQGFLLGEKHYLTYEEVMGKLRDMVRRENPLFNGDIDPRLFFRIFVVRPRHIFQRIRAQSGAFLLSARHRRFEASEVGCFNESIPIYDHYKLKVPFKKQSHIKRQLQLLNVTRETLFPGLDESAKAVNESFGFSRVAQ